MSVLPSDVAYYASLYDPGYDGSTTLNGAITTTTATAIVATSVTSFPTTGEFDIQIDSEIMRVTQGAGTVNWTVIRGFGGTTAATHLNGAAITMPMGGPVDFTVKIAFTDMTSGDTLDYLSTSASDTLVQIESTVRDTTGVFQVETKTLNGQTIVNGSQVGGRLLKAGIASVTTAAASVTSSATALTVASSAALPASGNYYIQISKEIMQVTAGQGTTSLTVSRGQMGTTATAHNSGDGVRLLPLGDVAIVDHTKVVSAHTAQAGSANASGSTPALMKLQSGDGSTVSIGQVIHTTGGTGPNQLLTIVAITGYGADVVAVSRNWGTVPDATTTYDVYRGVQLDLLPNQVTGARRFIYNAASDVPTGSTHIFYQKVFAVNNNTTTALTGAVVEFLSESPTLPSGALLDLATATAQNDNVTAINRQTALASGYGSFVTQPSFVSYGANSATLASGAAPNAGGAQGIEARLTLPAGAAPYNGAVTIRTQGNTI